MISCASCYITMSGISQCLCLLPFYTGNTVVIWWYRGFCVFCRQLQKTEAPDSGRLINWNVHCCWYFTVPTLLSLTLSSWSYLCSLCLCAEKLADCLRLPAALLLQAQVFFCFRVLLLRVSSRHLTALWPTIITELVSSVLADYSAACWHNCVAS